MKELKNWDDCSREWKNYREWMGGAVIFAFI